MGLEPVRVPPYAFSVNEQALGYLSLEDEGGVYCRESHSAQLAEDTFQAGPLGGRLKDRESFSRSLDALLGRLVVRPESASLVVPDNWLRMVFVELEEWPRRPAEQLELLRFKLGKIVPYRVHELRVGFERVSLLEGSGHRFLVGFSIEAALAELEELFAARGIRLGNVSCASLALFEALDSVLANAPLGAFVLVNQDRYSLMASKGGVPVVYRSKALPPGSSLEPVSTELRLTRKFLQERIPPGVLSEVVLVASERDEAQWSEMLEATFDRPISALSQEWPAIPGLTEMSVHEAAPLLGAALREVA